MDKTVELLNNKSLREGNIEKKIIEMSFYPQNYFDKFRHLISQAYNKGFGLVRLNDFSFLDIVNFELVKDMDGVIHELEASRDPIVSRWDDRTFSFNNSARLDFSPIAVPYSIFPLKERICADLMFGKLSVNYNINFTEFEKYLQQRNIQIYERPEEIIERNGNLQNQYLYCFKKNNFYLKIPPMMLHKLVFELSHPNVLIKEFLYLKDILAPNEADQVLTSNTQEARLWK